MTTPVRDATEEKPLRVRRGRVDSVDLYEIKDNELDLLEKGSPASLYLNFAVFLLSIAFSALAAISTVTTFRHPLVETVFVVIMVVGFILGALLLILWQRERRSVAEVIEGIRRRIPPDITSASPSGVVIEDREHMQPTEPKG